MGTGGRQLWSLTASLTALASLSACGAHTGESATSAVSATPMTAANPAVTTTTAIAAPVATPAARTKNWVDLDVGDCLADSPPTDPSVVTVTIVGCAAAHRAEVYYRSPVAVNAAVADVATRQCDLGFSQYTGRQLAGSPFAVTYLIDSDQDRTTADPTPSTVICLLEAANGQPLGESAHR